MARNISVQNALLAALHGAASWSRSLTRSRFCAAGGRVKRSWASFWKHRTAIRLLGGAPRRPARRAAQCFLQATPITCLADLADESVRALESAVLTSATLAVAGEFEYIAQPAGHPHARDWWSRRTSNTKARRCSTCRRTCPIRVTRALSCRPRNAFARFCALPAAARSASSPAIRRCDRCTSACARNRLSDAAARQRAQERAAGRVPRSRPMRAVRDLVVLARGGRAGRSVELRHHRQAAVRGPQRSRG